MNKCGYCGKESECSIERGIEGDDTYPIRLCKECLVEFMDRQQRMLEMREAVNRALAHR